MPAYAVDAITIWECQFEGRSEVNGNPVARPGDDLVFMTFSRFPLEIELVIEGSVETGICLYLASMIDGSRIRLDSSPSDQIIVGTTWYPMDQEVYASLTEVLAEKGIVLPGTINVGQLVWLRHMADQLPLILQDRSLLTNASRIALPRVDVLGLNAKLFDYQETGVAFLQSIASESLGCILADEMGLGKTLQVIALLLLEKQSARGPNLVICPATLLENWRREILQFAPGLQILVHAGAQRSGTPLAFKRFDIVITSYETATRDQIVLSSLNWNVVVLDEAQNIKNPEAQRTLAVKSLTRRVSLPVTGTPVENRLTDLWSIADFALPGLLGKCSDFETSYDDSHEDATRLAPLVAPFLLRRRVVDVATDLPSRIDVLQAISMTRTMAEQYENIRQAIEVEYGRSGALVALGKLRQYCTHPQLLGIDWPEPAKGMPKYMRLLEILEEIFARGEKALLFTSYTEMTDLFIADIPKHFQGVWHGFIDGRQPVTQRQPLVDRFSKHNGPGFLSLNPKAAGVGLNITAANHVIHYNPEWNPALEDQASARAYRRKQTRPVTVHHLFFADSVEEVVVDRLKLKRGLASSAVIGHEGIFDVTDIARALQISPLMSNGILE